MKLTRFLVVFFCFTLFFASCSSDDDNGVSEEIPANSIRVSVNGENDFDVSENASTLEVDFATTTISSEDLVISYEISGTAVNGEDYSLTEGNTITIPANETSFTLPITLLDDEAVEEDKTLVINLMEVGNSNFSLDPAFSELTITIQDDDSFPFENGFFVLNEGGSSAGTVTHVSQDLESSQQAIYQAVNPGDDLGNFLQSIFFDGDLAYIISNGSNIITVVNRYTFELVGKVESGLDVPRYGIVENGKAYVTNQASFTTNDDDFVAVIDIASLQVEESIIIGDAVEFIEEENGKLYIQNATYGTGNKISVFNPVNNQVETTVTTANALNSFEAEDGKLYALSGSMLEVFNLSDLTLLNEVSLSYGTAAEPLVAKNLKIEDGQIYFTADKSVYTMNLNAAQAPTNALLTYSSNSAFGAMYGFEVENDRIYVADGGDFASDSFVEVYDLSGNLLKNITVGVGPNGFYFNN
jgi:hypothetical protein